MGRVSGQCEELSLDVRAGTLQRDGRGGKRWRNSANQLEGKSIISRKSPTSRPASPANVCPSFTCDDPENIIKAAHIQPSPPWSPRRLVVRAEEWKVNDDEIMIRFPQSMA